MAAIEKKILTYEGLSYYDEKIKTKIENDDASTLQSAKTYANSLSDNYDAAGTAQTKVDALANGQVKTNTDAIAKLNGNETTVGSVAKAVADAKTALTTEINKKAGKATTLSGYGITDAYTKAQTDSAITTAVANAEHLKREIVDSLPTVSSADVHTIYMVLKSGGTGNQKYDEYMLINGAFEKIGDSAVDLTNYATKTEVTSAKSEAISTAATDATTKSNKALTDAKSYADSLADNYATATQGTKADSALQSDDIKTGTGNGTIKVKEVDIPVKGLGSAAYKSTGSASGNIPVNGAALGTTANVPVVTNASGQLIPHASGALGTAAFKSSDYFEKSGTAQTKVDALANGAVATNTSEINTLKTKVSDLESTHYIEITNEEIDALFV